MKVAVITRHAITNYGSLLQTLATQKIIEKLGYQCEIINYVRYDELPFRIEKTLLNQKSEWSKNHIKKLLYMMIRQPESILAGKMFEKFQMQYLNLTHKYIYTDTLIADKPVADVYMTGSDQVWGPMANGSYDSTYFLSFTSDNDKRISYAASFGRTKMTKKTADYCKKYIGRYSHVTVREDSAVEILESIGIKAEQVLDPTLLFDAVDWSEYLEPISLKRYVLVYQIHNDDKLGKYAQKVAKKKGLPLVRISPYAHHVTREGKLKLLVTPGKFLSYIRNAECLITDSFHGTAFAINFNVPFVEVLPNNNTGTRNISILNMTGLSERILKNDNDISLADQKIDYKLCNEILKYEREKSLEIIKQIIEN